MLAHLIHCDKLIHSLCHAYPFTHDGATQKAHSLGEAELDVLIRRVGALFGIVIHYDFLTLPYPRSSLESHCGCSDSVLYCYLPDHCIR